jgi:hypothetical protein
LFGGHSVTSADDHSSEQRSHESGGSNDRMSSDDEAGNDLPPVAAATPLTDVTFKFDIIFALYFGKLWVVWTFPLFGLI